MRRERGGTRSRGGSSFTQACRGARAGGGVHPSACLMAQGGTWTGTPSKRFRQISARSSRLYVRRTWLQFGVWSAGAVSWRSVSVWPGFLGFFLWAFFDAWSLPIIFGSPPKKNGKDGEHVHLAPWCLFSMTVTAAAVHDFKYRRARVLTVCVAEGAVLG